MTFGSDAHLPRQIRLPSRRIETTVSFIDTSRPIYSSIGCSPSDAWARRQVVSPYFHPIGEQPPASIAETASGGDRSRDYPMWTTSVPPSRSRGARAKMVVVEERHIQMEHGRWESLSPMICQDPANRAH
jgi:hypothetical protein